MAEVIQCDGRTRIVRTDTGYVLTRADGVRSAEVYETSAQALRALVTDAVAWVRGGP